MLLKIVVTASVLCALLLGAMVWWSNMVGRKAGTDALDGFMSETIKNPDAPGREGHPQIFEAIEDSDHDRVARLIASGANLEARGFGQRTPILKAALSDNWIIVEMLLAAGADPMVPDEFGITLLELAADTHLKPESDEGQALTRVRSILADRGLITLIFKPAEVRKMVAEGRWPPEEFKSKLASKVVASEAVHATLLFNSPLKLELTLFNASQQSVLLNPIKICRDGNLEGKLFEIEDSNGSPVRYIGKMKKMAPPSFDEFLELAPGESNVATCFLGDKYDFSKERQSYRVRYKAYHSHPDPELGLLLIKSNWINFEN